MIEEVVSQMGPWTWLLVGFALMALELVLPGVFLMWFGLAAVTVGGLAIMPFSDVSWYPWQWQLATFAVLSVVYAALGRQLVGTVDDEPVVSTGLNDRTASLVGRRVTLVSAIENGTGRARVGDTTWRVEGADRPAGESVTVTGANGDALLVE